MHVMVITGREALPWRRRGCNTLLLAVILFVAPTTVCSLVMGDAPQVQPRINYRTERNVIIRQVNWTGGMMPLQIYSGKPLPDLHLTQHPHPSEIPTMTLSKSPERMLLNTNHDASASELERYESKLQAQARASRVLVPDQHLHVLYRDAHICVVHKPSGVLSVPGPRRNPSVANLVHSVFQPTAMNVDQMVVHRLDMDTSGVVVYALTESALKRLHQDFRERDNRVKKTYEALVCGHLSVSEGEIDLPLERDPTRPPFMRVSLGEGRQGDEENRSFGAFAKHIDKAPKPSLTECRVLSRHYLKGVYPVTRVELKPWTGRTHQLRVHCAAIGHPILGDDIYGLGGEGSLDGGLLEPQQLLFGDRATLALQNDILRNVPTNLCLHSKQLCIYHPFSGAPMVFEALPNF